MKLCTHKVASLIIVLLAIFAGPHCELVAQNVAKSRVIVGRVTDQNGDPVVGAMVVLSGTTVGAATDNQGNYSLPIKQNSAVLEFSSLGYETQTVSLNDRQITADVVMATEVIALDEAVMVGYGVQNKRDITTSISSIKAEDFRDAPAADFREAMAAKMPGVQVLNLGGSPEGNISVRIRGIQSATAGNEPLYVIDGIPSDARAFSNLESSDIESLEAESWHWISGSSIPCSPATPTARLPDVPKLYLKSGSAPQTNAPHK